MRKVLLCASLSIVAAVFVSPSATAHTSDQADEAFDSYVDVFWDDDVNYFFTNSDHEIDPDHAHGPEGGLYTDYWWEAQLWEMVMDNYERTGSSESRELIDDVYDGFEAAYPDFSDNDWNDDIGWWALGSVRAYELTGEAEYLDASRTMFDHIAQYEDSTYGGGIWWKNVDVGDGTKNEKNVATNATAVNIAMRLYDATGDETYLATAKRLYAWLDSNFNVDGRLVDNVSGEGEYSDANWTYNQGTFAGAALQLYLHSGDSAYLDDATTAIDWAVENLTSSGTFLHEGKGDGGGFKAILTRNIRDLIDEAGQTQYEQVLTDNATQAANHLNADGIGGYDWAAPAPDLGSTAIQSLGAGANVAVMQQATPDGYTGVVEGDGVYEAENALADDIDTESTAEGYSGRGYLAGWNTDDTSVTFNVNVAESGTYPVDMRYSAAAGDATRSLSVNGSKAPTVDFGVTDDWDTWDTTTVEVALEAGHNTIELHYDESAGSSNHVNFDRIALGL